MADNVIELSDDFEVVDEEDTDTIELSDDFKVVDEEDPVKEITEPEMYTTEDQIADIPLSPATLPKPSSKKEELKQRRLMTLSGGLPILPTDAISRIGPAAVGKTVAAPFSFAKFFGELAAPDVVKPITNFVDDIDNEVSKNKLMKIILDTFKGKGLSITEDQIARLPTYIGGVKLGKDALQAVVKKITKDQKKLKKASGILGGGAGFTGADAITRKEDEPMVTPNLSYLLGLGLEYMGIEKTEELVDIASKLNINPDDTIQKKRAKELLDSVASTAAFAPVVTILSSPFLLGKLSLKGFQKLRAKKEAIDDGITVPPENTSKSRVNSSEVVEEIEEKGAEPVLKQRNKITEVLAKINTRAGRLLSSNAALPKKVFEAAIRRSRADKASDLEVKVALEDLLRMQKKTKTSDDQLYKIINENVNDNLDPRMLEQVNKLKTTISNKESEINKLLGLSEKDKIGLGFNKGEVYFTRMFEASNNPKYLKEIKKALEYVPWSGKKVNTTFLSKIENARNMLRKQGVEEKDLNGTIMTIVERLSGKESGGLLNNLFENMAVEVGKTSSKAAQVLRKKDPKIKKPILELLGEVKDPISKISATLSNQNKVIAELKYFTEIDNFFRKNAGKEVELKGLIPGIGGARTKVVGSKVGGIDERGRLATLSEEAIGNLGGRSKLLRDIYVNPQTYTYIKNGLELFNPTGGNFLTRTFSQIAAYGQSTQTLLDFPAYFINTYGAIQGLISNGVLFNTKLGSQALTSLNTFGQSLSPIRTAKVGFVKIPGVAGYVNRAALDKLDKLKRAGVIDTDLTSEMIFQNINTYGKKVRSKAGKLGGLYSEGMSKLSTAYGSPDTYSKLLAFEAEHAALKAIHKGTKSADELFDLAAQRVRDTMPSYSVAAPAARSLSRLPIGTYALFPSEMVRTSKNIIKYGFTDLKNGVKTGNVNLIKHGLKRLTGIGITGAGIEYAVNDNNQQLGLTDIEHRAIDILSPDWAKSGKRLHDQSFMEDKDGNIITRYSNSYSFDAMDYLKVPIRALIGKVLAGKDISDVEIDEVLKGMGKSVIGPYANPKFVTEAIIDIVRQEYSEVPGEEGVSVENIKRVWNELRPAVLPGTLQILDKYIEALDSEKVRELNKGINRYGFPQTSRDVMSWMTSGIRPITMNLEKAVGFNLSDDIRKLNTTKDAFMKTLQDLPDQPYTPEIRQTLMNRYRELQEAKYKSMQDLSDKIQIFKQVSYTNKEGKKTPFGLERILSSVTDKFYYKIPDEVIYANRVKEGLEAEGGIFIPDQIELDEKLRRVLEKKSFSATLLSDLAKISAEFAGMPLKSNIEISDDFELVE